MAVFNRALLVLHHVIAHVLLIGIAYARDTPPPQSQKQQISTEVVAQVLQTFTHRSVTGGVGAKLRNKLLGAV